MRRKWRTDFSAESLSELPEELPLLLEEEESDEESAVLVLRVFIAERDLGGGSPTALQSAGFASG